MIATLRIPEGALLPREAKAAPVEGAEEFVFCAREGIPAHPLGKSCVAVLLVAHTRKEQDGNHTRYATTCDKRCEASRGAYRNALEPKCLASCVEPATRTLSQYSRQYW